MPYLLNKHAKSFGDAGGGGYYSDVMLGCSGAAASLVNTIERGDWI